MRHLLKTISLLLLTASFSGCQTPNSDARDYVTPTEIYHVYVNSINDGENHKKQKYILMPGLKDVSESDLQFKEYAAYIHRAMKIAGYEKAQTSEEADIGILFAYGIGDPEKETSYQTSSYATTIPSYYNYSAFSTSTTKANTVVRYTRNIILDAYDNIHYQNTGEERQVWITSAISTGSRADLRIVLPVMVAAITPHIGSNTGRQLKLIVGSPSKELYEILGKPIPTNK